MRIVAQECGLTPTSAVADIGSGTGKLAELFLAHGNPVQCVEPDPGMRAVARRELAAHPGFTIVAGRAEQTTLLVRSVDVVVAGQAFHWFDPESARVELARILRPPRPVALIWNTRQTETTEFLAAYERFLRAYGTDYAPARHGRADPDSLRRFYGPTGYRKRVLAHADTLDLSGLMGRVASASYMPATGAPGHDAMTAALESLFAAHQEAGRVEFRFDTEVYAGTLA